MDINDTTNPLPQQLLDIEQAAALLNRAREVETANKEREARLNDLEQKCFGPDGNGGLLKRIADAVDRIDATVGKVAVAEKEIMDFHRDVHGDEEKKITGLKKELEELKAAFAEQAKTQTEAFETRYKQIEDLLPGATSVGMAAAYREQKNANRGPLWIWSAVFVLTMASMIWYTITHFEPSATIGGAFMRLLSHLPILAFSVWLGVFAGKKVSQYFRVQQEFGHKESMSKSYVGFSREVEKLPANERTDKLREMQLENMVKMGAENPSATLDNSSHEEKPPMFERIVTIVFGSKGSKPE